VEGNCRRRDNAKAKIERKFSKSRPKWKQILTVLGIWGLLVRDFLKSFDFYCKRHVLARIHVV